MTVRQVPWVLWAIALVVLTNAAALSGVWWNRLPPAEATLRLSPAELQVVPSGSVDTPRGEDLQLDVRWAHVQFVPPGATDTWLSHVHLRQNGITATWPAPIAPGTPPRKGPPDRDIAVYAVLELDGTAYADLLQRQCAVAPTAGATASEVPLSPPVKRVTLCEMTRAGSRLYVMDAGASRDALRERYPDRHRYAIVPGVLTLRADPAHLFGDTVLAVPSRRVAVGDAWRWQVADALKAGTATRATVVFGRSLEPWLAALERDPAATSAAP